jgi:NADH:ubiquinone reductase (H+-translocating)
MIPTSAYYFILFVLIPVLLLTVWFSVQFGHGLRRLALVGSLAFAALSLVGMLVQVFLIAGVMFGEDYLEAHKQLGKLVHLFFILTFQTALVAFWPNLRPTLWPFTLAALGSIQAFLAGEFNIPLLGWGLDLAGSSGVLHAFHGALVPLVFVVGIASARRSWTELGLGAHVLPLGGETTTYEPPRQRVVVVGGGFGGLQAVRKLREAPVEVTLVDRQNFHLFQPLVYQVATGALSAAEIAAPLRSVLKHQANARVVLGEVTGFDLERRQVLVDRLPHGGGAERLEYDTLVVAAGAHYSYFGHDDWSEHAPELKSLAGAVDIRNRILTAFEAAEVEQDEELRRSWLTFVVVGGGPTGVEIAGQIAELARDTLRRDFRSADPQAARVLLVESVDRMLPTFPTSLSHNSARALAKLGATPLVRHTVIDVGPESVAIRSPDGTIVDVPTRTVVWAAGVTASPLAGTLASAAGAEVDRAGRLFVLPDLTIPGHPEVFAIGDMVSVRRRDGTTLPGVAAVAMQQGRYVAGVIRKRLRYRAWRPFRYRNKGDLATIGRSKAVADLKYVRLSGFIAWVLWLLVHLYYLVGFQNRLLVVTRWASSYLTRGRGARLINKSEPDVAAAATVQKGEPRPEPDRATRRRAPKRAPRTSSAQAAKHRASR